MTPVIDPLEKVANDQAMDTWVIVAAVGLLVGSAVFGVMRKLVTKRDTPP
jgi:hypothetical protein